MYIYVFTVYVHLIYAYFIYVHILHFRMDGFSQGFFFPIQSPDGVLVNCHCCLAFYLLSWGHLIFNNIIDLCCFIFMLSLWSCFDTICIVGQCEGYPHFSFFQNISSFLLDAVLLFPRTASWKSLNSE